MWFRLLVVILVLGTTGCGKSDPFRSLLSSTSGVENTSGEGGDSGTIGDKNGGGGSDDGDGLGGDQEPPYEDGSCDKGNVRICHIPPGNAEAKHSLCVGAPAVAAHARNHGDYEGDCRE